MTESTNKTNAVNAFKPVGCKIELEYDEETNEQKNAAKVVKTDKSEPIATEILQIHIKYHGLISCKELIFHFTRFCLYFSFYSIHRLR